MGLAAIIVVLQARTLIRFEPPGFDRGCLAYIVIPEFVAGIGLMAYSGLRERKRGKR